jgi:tetratricopeptide (TPR) repeat protein
MLIRAAEKARQQRRFRQALIFIRQALEIWPLDVDPRARLCIPQEMARCASNCREHSLTRLAWEEILETASDVERVVEAHRQLSELDLVAGFFDDAGRHLETAAELSETSLAASEAAGCWLAYADYLANRLLVRKAREAVACASQLAEKSENPALIPEAIGYTGLVQGQRTRMRVSDKPEGEIPAETAINRRDQYRFDYFTKPGTRPRANALKSSFADFIPWS